MRPVTRTVLIRGLGLLLALATLPALTACSSADKLPAACLDNKPESGRCRAAFTRYWFDERAGTCKAFIWGGCGGTVPFETLEDCHAQCMPGQPLPELDAAKKQIFPAVDPAVEKARAEAAAKAAAPGTTEPAATPYAP